MESHSVTQGNPHLTTPLNARRRIGLHESLDAWPGIAVILMVTAAWISCGAFQYYQAADSLIQVLVSLQRWTPFYWGGDRFGMLVPLLTVPIRNPLTNLMLQSMLTVFAAMAAGFLAVRYFFDEPALWYLAAVLQNVWLLCLVQRQAQFDWFVAQAYGLSLALGLGALVALRKGRTVAGLILMLLCHWVNFGAFLVLLPLVILQHLIRREGSGLFRELVVIACSILAGLVAKNVLGHPKTPNQSLPFAMWPSGWKLLGVGVRIYVITSPRALWWIIVPSLAGLIVALLKKSQRYVILVAGTLVAVGTANWAVVGTQSWVKENLYSPRYVFPSLFLFALGGALLTVTLLQGYRFGHQRWTPVVGTALLVLVSAVVYGIPSRATVQHKLDAKFGSYTDEILANHATLVGGDFWTVWPAVFHANMTLYGRHQPTAVYGLGYRSEATSGLWSYQRSLCAAVPLDDPAAEALIRSSGLHFAVVRQSSKIQLLCEPCQQ